MSKSFIILTFAALVAMGSSTGDAYDLQVVPTQLTNNVMAGFAPSNQFFTVTNAATGTVDYAVTFTDLWINACTPAGGTLGSFSNDTITIAYSNSIANWPAGTASNTAIIISSTNAPGATQTVAVAMNIMARPAPALNPLSVTQTIAKGDNPGSRQFAIWNESVAPAVPMGYALTLSNGSPELIQSLLDTGGGVVQVGQTNSITINYMDISAVPAGVYTALVQIATWDAGTNYAPTGMVQWATSVVVSVEVVALDPPTGVAATEGAYTDQVIVNWNPVSNAASYKVYRFTTFDSTIAELIGETVGTSFSDLTGIAGVLYYYWVSSVNTVGGEGALSSNRVTGYRGLAAPGGIFASDGAFTNKVHVTWPQVDGATAYQLYRGSPGGALVPIYFTATGSYDDVSVLPGVHYEYRVSATNGVFGSPLSVGEIGFSFGIPGNLAASDGTFVDKVRLTWDAVELAAQYEVWRSTRDVLPPQGGAVKIATVTTPIFDDTSVTPGSMYYYFVRASGLEAGIGGWSNSDRGYSAEAGVNLSIWDLVVLPVQVGAGGSPTVVSFRMSNAGGANLVGVNGTVGMAFFATTNQVLGAGNDILIGKVVDVVTLMAGEDMVVKIAGNRLVLPTVEEDYNIFVRVLPEFPSLLADTNPVDNVAKRNGSLRVRASGGLNYQVFNDFDGDGISDLGVYRGMAWSIRSVDGRVLIDQTPVFRGAGTPVLGDLDGDRRADPMVHDSASGLWQVLFSGNNYTAASGSFGGNGTRGIVADYEGVGRGDASVFHEGNGSWFVLTSTGRLTLWNWGEAGFDPVIGDYNGDGRWDMAVYQESTGAWFVRTLDGQLLVSGAVWGGPGLRPVPGDFDGDGFWDAAIYAQDSGRWYIVSLDGRILALGIALGGPGFEPVMGDYDGDGKWDLAVYQESTGLWLVKSLDGRILTWASHWGGPGNRPIGN